MSIDLPCRYGACGGLYSLLAPSNLPRLTPSIWWEGGSRGGDQPACAATRFTGRLTHAQSDTLAMRCTVQPVYQKARSAGMAARPGVKEVVFHASIPPALPPVQ